MRLSKFSPIARAIAVIGATAGLVTGVTFAALTSNTVALTPNTFDVATASLAIGLGSGAGCDTDVADVPGFTNTPLSPGVASAPVNFCLENTGDVAMNVTAAVTGLAPGGGEINPNLITLTLVCSGYQPISGTLDQYTGGSPVANPLAAGAKTDCSATATLSSSYVSGDGATVPAFDIEFVGTQV